MRELPLRRWSPNQGASSPATMVSNLSETSAVSTAVALRSTPVKHLVEGDVSLDPLQLPWVIRLRRSAGPSFGLPAVQVLLGKLSDCFDGKRTTAEGGLAHGQLQDLGCRCRGAVPVQQLLQAWPTTSGSAPPACSRRRSGCRCAPRGGKRTPPGVHHGNGFSGAGFVVRTKSESAIPSARSPAPPKSPSRRRHPWPPRRGSQGKEPGVRHKPLYTRPAG